MAVFGLVGDGTRRPLHLSHESLNSVSGVHSMLKFLQVLPQHGPSVLCAHHSALL
jgi:hypothetical protein